MWKIEKLVFILDTSFDHRVDLDEILDYIYRNGLQNHISERIATEMYDEAASWRQNFRLDSMTNIALNNKEIYAATRINYRYD